MASNEEDVPVLKISIDNTDEFNAVLGEDDSLDIDTSDLQYGEANKEAQSSSGKEDQPLVVDSSKTSSNQTRRYENPSGAFVTGVDITSKESLEKKERRAKRFGIDYKPLPSLSDEAMKELYESVGITDVEKERQSERGIRCDAVHIRGVDEMSTKDVFNYFADFGPAEVEWIDDRSCNVVWLEAVTAARAMKALSYDPAQKKQAHSQKDTAKSSKPAKEEDPDDLNLMSDEEMEEDKPEEEEEEKATEMDTDDKEKKADRSEGECSTDDDADEASDKMPPGKWRIGHKFNKTQRLYLRFATKADKKLPGAERKSKYYQKYGNPNYGGVTGIISASRKRRMLAEMRRLEEEEARRAVSNNGRTISPVISNDNNLFDIHTEDIEEGFGVVSDRKKDHKKEEDDDEEEEEDGEIEEFGVERRRGGRERRLPIEDEYEEVEDMEDDYMDPEIQRMEQELQVLLQQNPELDEEGEGGEAGPKMRMHADEEEQQIVLRRERTKRLQALQAIHKLDKEIREARRSGRMARDSSNMDSGMDARSRIQARRNQRQQYPPPPTGIFRTVSPPDPAAAEEEVVEREFISREELDDEALLNETMPFKDRPPLKVSCEFDRSDEPQRPGKVDYYSATRWKQMEGRLSPSPPPPPSRQQQQQRPKPHRHKSASSSSSKQSSSHMDRYSRREERNVRGRLGERRHRSERSYRENPKDTYSGSQRRAGGRAAGVRERVVEDRARERRAMKDRLGAEKRTRRGARDEAPPPPSRPPRSPPKRGIRRGNMVFVTDSEESVDEESEEETKTKKGDEEKWPKLSLLVQSDDDDNFDL